MKVSSIVAIALIGAVGAAPATQHGSPSSRSDALTAKGVKNLEAYLAKNGYPNPKKCNKTNTVVRKEWYAFESEKRQLYGSNVVSGQLSHHQKRRTTSKP